MWIILEGVNFAGKSTLRDALIEALQQRGHAVKVNHALPPKEPTRDCVIRECLFTSPATDDTDEVDLSAYEPGCGWSIVSDRLHWGCPVYGPIKRPDTDDNGYGELGIGGWRYIELFLASRGATTFLMTEALETLHERAAARGFKERDPQVEELKDLQARYEWLSCDSVTLALTLEASKFDDVRKVATRCVGIASAHEALCSGLSRHLDYVGPHNPQTLVICEPDRNSRIEVLEAATADQWHTVGMASSAKTVKALHHLNDVLGHPRVVGLGELTPDADQFLYTMGGSTTDNPADVFN